MKINYILFADCLWYSGQAFL